MAQALQPMVVPQMPDGSLGIDALWRYGDRNAVPYWCRAGEYYLCPKERVKTCVIDPAPYDVGGKMIMLASFTSPILVNGQFRGIAGADLAVNFIQELRQSRQPAL